VPVRGQMKMFTQAVDSLRKGNSLVTFAEGTRSTTGRLLAFKKGAFRIAKEVRPAVGPNHDGDHCRV
jgi:1-acyl-sn-glycerol-3-phosphate acyltransferase